MADMDMVSSSWHARWQGLTVCWQRRMSLPLLWVEDQVRGLPAGVSKIWTRVELQQRSCVKCRASYHNDETTADWQGISFGKSKIGAVAR